MYKATNPSQRSVSCPSSTPLRDFQVRPSSSALVPYGTATTVAPLTPAGSTFMFSTRFRFGPPGTVPSSVPPGVSSMSVSGGVPFTRYVPNPTSRIAAAQPPLLTRRSQRNAIPLPHSHVPSATHATSTASVSAKAIRISARDASRMH